MIMKKIIIILLVTATTNCALAQLSTNESPISFDSKIGIALNDNRLIPIVTMPSLDMIKIEKEDLEDEEHGLPPRFGYAHKVNFNLTNSGIWRVLPNGDKLWQLNIVCPEALSVNFLYDRFWIPDGGKLFIYSSDRSHSIGAFTSKNNKGDSITIRGFATELVYGSSVVLEYYQPKEVTAEAIISIESVVHGYRIIDEEGYGFGHSGPCQVNVNCEEGQNWQNEKKSVALIVVNGERFATGSLLNSTDFGQKPYFLTANHCLYTDYGQYDAVTDPILDYYIFYWGYEAPGCVNISVEPQYFSTSGAIVLSNNDLSDFALLRLSEDPKDLLGYEPYYLGWDCSGASGGAGVCIHHPHSDVKKISTVAFQPISTNDFQDQELSNGAYWRVTWKETLNGYGTTEEHSSGSALLNSAHKVIGQLFGGYSDCDLNYDEPDWFGRFSVSWTSEGNASIYRRLNCWLDSLGTGLQTLDGLLVVSDTKLMDLDEQLYSNIKITSTGQLTIQGEVEIMGSGRVFLESGGVLVIDRGSLTNVDLVLKPGSTLRLINGGSIETRNGFNVPVGVIVSIDNGQII